jgi:adenine phosphoribosyltransferase
MNLKEHIRSVKDFPKPGIMFRDITTLLNDAEALKYTFQELFRVCKDLNINKVVGIESRGFMFGCMLAEKLNAGFVPVRKPGKLPYKTIREEYDLEYGCDSIEMHSDAIEQGDIVLLHDDLLATGGTARAAANLVERSGGKVVLASFIVELSFLKGRDKLQGYNIHSLVNYDSED